MTQELGTIGPWPEYEPTLPDQQAETWTGRRPRLFLTFLAAIIWQKLRLIRRCTGKRANIARPELGTDNPRQEPEAGTRTMLYMTGTGTIIAWLVSGIDCIWREPVAGSSRMPILKGAGTNIPWTEPGSDYLWQERGAGIRGILFLTETGTNIAWTEPGSGKLWQEPGTGIRKDVVPDRNRNQYCLKGTREGHSLAGISGRNKKGYCSWYLQELTLPKWKQKASFSDRN